MIVISTDVFCDGRKDDGSRCLAWTSGTTGRVAERAEARKQARGRGWVLKSGRDLCPRCAAKAR